MYQVSLSNQAKKDLEKLKKSNLSKKAKELVDAIAEDPYGKPSKKLVGNLRGFYSRRINIQHRLVYKVYEEEKVVVIVSMWSHYGDN